MNNTNNSLDKITRSRVWVFSQLANAQSFANRCVEPHCIVLGDHDGERGQYWVATLADAQRLERAGYEIL